MTRVKSQIQHDYKSLVNPPQEGDGAPGRRWFLLGLVVPLLIVFGVLVFSRGNASPAGDAAQDDAAEIPAASSEVTGEPTPAAEPAPAAEHTGVPTIARTPQIEPAAAKPVNAPDDAAQTVRALDLPAPHNNAALGPDPATPAAARTQIEPPVTHSNEAAPPSAPLAASVAKATAPAQNAAGEGHVIRALPIPPRQASDEHRPQVATELPGTPLVLTVKSGDSLDALFGRHGLSRGDLATLLKLPEAKKALTLLMPGDEIAVRHDAERILSLTRALDEVRTLNVTRDDDGFTARIDEAPVEIRVQHASATITSSLFLAAKAAGISDTLTMNLAGIFAWDIDFVLDIRTGDRFSVIYEEIWQDGRHLRDGNILAARFVNRGDAFEAVRYTDPDGNDGYFTPEGVNVKKAFLRAPIKFTPRVTSNFNPRRMHPVHKRVRPHRGVDYGAPTGTPILAAGDGKVIFRGRKGGYGNTVILQHGGNITTLYAHMSKFNNNVRSGSRVRQGQVIGYVGASGTVTARHLHYEYRVNGVHRNPRTVSLPKAKPIPQEFAADFRKSARPLVAQLNVVSRERKRLAVAAAAN